MTHSADLPRLYRGQINLWVEDAVTHQYLEELWLGSPVQFLIGGGSSGVGAVVNDARANGYSNVFGLVDRDFGPTNYSHWDDETKGFLRFVLPVFELENYLLDARSLAESDVNTAGKTQADIEAIMRDRASELVWWMTCRDVIARLRQCILDDFMKQPKWTDIADLAGAEEYILQSKWHANISSRVDRIASEMEVRAMLEDAHAQYDSQLASDKWLRSFSGKEILRHVRSRVYNPPVRPASQSDLDADVAKSVAKCQMESEGMPQDLADLLTALKRKARVP